MRFKFCVLLLLVFGAAPVWAAKQCSEQQVQLQVLGSGGPELNDGRASSSYLLWHNGKARVLIDAGSGSSIRYGESGARFAHLEAILLTHLHTDHSADLPAFVKGGFFTDRTRKLLVAGPDGNGLMPSTSRYVKALFGEFGAFPYLKDNIESRDWGFRIVSQDASLERDRTTAIALNDEITATAIPVHHGPVASVAWRIDVAGCRVSFSGDMSNRFDVFADFAKGSDLLVMHHAIPEQTGRIEKFLHMQPSVIGDISQRAKAKKLLLAHFMRRTLTKVDANVALVKNTYKGPVVLAEDLLMVDL